MSSILDALEKLERTRPPTMEPVPVVVPPPRRTRVIVLVGSAFAAGAVLALGLLRSRPAVTPEVAAPPRGAAVPTYAHLEPPAVRRPPAGAPAVRLSFLLYSPAPGRRTVALAIENHGLETLHEGETSNDGVEIVRILPDRVELGWNGERFTVRARD